jgi:hypothetical protein
MLKQVFADYSQRKEIVANSDVEKYTKLRLNEQKKTKYKKLKILRTRLLSKLPSIAFKPAGKYTKPYTKLTTKQA